MTIDGRGRLYVRVWLRRRPVPWLPVGIHDATSVVVIAPASVLDGLEDRPLDEAR